MEKIYGERVKETIPINTLLRCKRCNCTSKVDKKYLLSDEAVEEDRINMALVGGTFIVCPVCNHNIYFWGSKEE